MNWTADNIERLRVLWLKGLTCSQIAAELGTTKNSIIGKVHRLKLDRRRVGTPRKGQNYPRPSEPRKPRITLPKTAKIRSLPMSIPAPVTEGVSIVDVTGCRFPVGTGDVPGGHLFCNCEQRAKSMFCEYHSAIAFTANTKERRLTWLKLAA